MSIKDILTENLNISKLTQSSLEKAITDFYDRLPDNEKRRINREIAYEVIMNMADNAAQKESGKIVASVRHMNRWMKAGSSLYKD